MFVDFVKLIFLSEKKILFWTWSIFVMFKQVRQFGGRLCYCLQVKEEETPGLAELLQSATISRQTLQLNSVFLIQKTIHNTYWIYDHIYWCYAFFTSSRMTHFNGSDISFSRPDFRVWTKIVQVFFFQWSCFRQPARYSSYSLRAPSLTRDGSVFCAKTRSASMTNSYGVWYTCSCSQCEHSLGQAWPGQARPGQARSGQVRPGQARPGPVQQIVRNFT